MKKNVYNALIVITVLIFIVLSLYFLFKYNKYMIPNTKYNVISSSITYDDYNDQVFIGRIEMAKSFQELLDIEEYSDNVKKAFSTIKINDRPVNEYFNEDFFKNKNVIVIFDTVWSDSPNINIIKEKNIVNIYYNEKGGVTACGYARFIIVDKDIDDFEVIYNQFSGRFIILKEVLIEGILIAMIIVLRLRRDNKIDAGWEFVIAGIAIWIILEFAYVEGMYHF